MKHILIIIILLSSITSIAQNNLTYDQVVEKSNQGPLKPVVKQLLSAMGFDSIVRVEIKNHPKGLGEDFLISVPYKWEKEEGLRPHIVSVFNLKNAHPSLPNGTIILSIRKLDRTYNKLELKALFTKEALSKMFINAETEDINVTELSYNYCIDGFNTIIYEASFSKKFLDNRIIFFQRFYLLNKDDTMITLSYSLSSPKENESVILPLYANSRKHFDLMAQNFVMLSQYY